MNNTLKIKHFLGPKPVVLISIALSFLLFKILNESSHTVFGVVLFYSLFLYWIAALIFIVPKFIKNRQAT